MKILEMLEKPWLIKEEAAKDIVAVVVSHLAGDKLDLKDLEMRVVSGDGKDANRVYRIENGKAIFEIFGPLMPRVSAFQRIFFNASGMVQIEESIKAAVLDSSVDQIILHINSPGGTVEYTKELSDSIRELTKKKEIISFTDGQIASAAYWIASATDKIYISSENTDIGSIGVATMHIDASEFYSKWGLKITDIYAGEYKRITTDSKPLSDKGREYLQKSVNEMHENFISAVSENRGKDISDVRKYANGAIYSGKQALSLGMVDGVSTLSQLIESGGGSENNKRKDGKMSEENKITVEFIESNHKSVYDQIFSAGQAAAVSAERGRLKKIFALNLVGAEDLKIEAIESGETAGDVSLKYISSEQSLRFQAQQEQGNNPPVEEQSESLSLTDEEKFNKDTKLKAEFGDYQTYLAYNRNKEAM